MKHYETKIKSRSSRLIAPYCFVLIDIILHQFGWRM
jgi:hypothetical protein